MRYCCCFLFPPVPKWKLTASNQSSPQSCFGATIRGNEIGPVLHLECTASLPENNRVHVCVCEGVHQLCECGVVR